MKKLLILVLCPLVLQGGRSWLDFFDYRKAGDSIGAESVKKVGRVLEKTQKRLDKSLEKVEKTFNESTDKAICSMNNFTDAINNATSAAKPIAWTGVGVAGAYVVYHICDRIAYQFSDEAAVKKLENKQKRELIAAKKTLLDSLKKNVAGAMGSFGLPKACDPAVQALVLLPGGKEELEKIIDLFKQYVSPK